MPSYLPATFLFMVLYIRYTAGIARSPSICASPFHLCSLFILIYWSSLAFILLFHSAIFLFLLLLFLLLVLLFSSSFPSPPASPPLPPLSLPLVPPSLSLSSPSPQEQLLALRFASLSQRKPDTLKEEFFRYRQAQLLSAAPTLGVRAVCSLGSLCHSFINGVHCIKGYTHVLCISSLSCSFF